MLKKIPVKIRKRKYAYTASKKPLILKEVEPPFYGHEGPIFLAYEKIAIIHTDQISRYGGTDGIRDESLLRSALAQPEVSYGGEWLHTDLFEMAAAYAFHICQNHPFLDGNKRTALVSALIFLELNGISFTKPQEFFLELTLSLAAGKISKAELANIFRSLPTE